MKEGRYRKLHCLIWNDDKFPYVTDDCQLVFFHIYFNPLSTSFGLFKASIEALAADKKWSLKRYRKSFQESLANGFFKYDWKTSVIYFPNFLRYNPPQNPNIVKGWSLWFKEIPNCALKNEWYQQLKSLVESLGESFKKAFKESLGESIGKTDTVSVSVTVTNNPPTPLTKGEVVDDKVGQKKEPYSEGFLALWKIAVRKVGKLAASRAWNRLRKTTAWPGDAEVVSAYKNNADNNPQWKKEGGRYVPHLTTWLNQGRWADEIKPKTIVPAPPPHKADPGFVKVWKEREKKIQDAREERDKDYEERKRKGLTREYGPKNTLADLSKDLAEKMKAPI